MSGSASRTRSPSSFNRTRRTPCVLGCCGPMLRSIHSVSGSCSGPKASLTTVASATDGVGLQPFELRIAEDHGLAERDVVLAQRMTFPGIRHQDPPQVRMAIEFDTEEIPGLAFMRVRRRPYGGQGGYV